MGINWRRVLLAIAALLFVIFLAGTLLLIDFRQRPFDRTAAIAEAASFDARIIRDAFGVPHIYGARDADVAFGLGYAHAEDDWKTIEDVLLFSRGDLARYRGRRAAVTDYLVAAMGANDAIRVKYASAISPETKSILSGYAAGMNLWCAEEQTRCAAGVAPITEMDVVAGFAAMT